ncbi:hypothetical protein [Kamptonema formosum]|uniref:hypothetical protein n=1 Tax=Kamptonema formosum TaxID=331992 RepID=UPI00034CEE19|nr:hypothetical protein [Oscillatoria sp. PCC 10802]
MLAAQTLKCQPAAGTSGKRHPKGAEKPGFSKKPGFWALSFTDLNQGISTTVPSGISVQLDA